MYISELHSYHRLLLLKFTRNPVHFFTHINCYMSIYAKKVSGTAYHSLRKKSFLVLSMAGLKLQDFPLFKLYEIWWVSFLLWQSVSFSWQPISCRLWAHFKWWRFLFIFLFILNVWTLHNSVMYIVLHLFLIDKWHLRHDKYRKCILWTVLLNSYFSLKRTTYFKQHLNGLFSNEFTKTKLNIE